MSDYALIISTVPTRMWEGHPVGFSPAIAALAMPATIGHLLVETDRLLHLRDNEWSHRLGLLGSRRAEQSKIARQTRKNPKTIVGVAKPALTTKPRASWKPQIQKADDHERLTTPQIRLTTQNGSDGVHNREKSEKMAATIESAMPIDRPIDGSTDCNPIVANCGGHRETEDDDEGESLGTSDVGLFANGSLRLELNRIRPRKCIHLAVRPPSW
ncbi:hypothetical protein ABH999_000807 [Bradyrhizobium yuanmingense]|uniref:hypothetical protein n=1 Tax=Bradyrhizobium yuanmingense TaxID=108015 RepID=UPI003519C2D1